MTHSPAPWRYVTDEHYAEVLPHTILAGDGSGVAGVCSEADARLIAAAPAMLAALDSAAGALIPPRTGEERETLSIILAAIQLVIQE